MAGLFPVWVGALGLGEAETRSALNQPLAVEIPVLSATSAEVAGLSVGLASPETFERYGLPLPSGLGDIDFIVTPSAGGGVIRITSARAVVEPFVTLLLDVRWSQGRLLREYTVLLDPPAFASGTVQQPVTAPERQAPVATAIERSSGVGLAPAVAPDPVTGEQVHTVANRETLWGIASQYRPDTSVDMNQMMLAIYRANPEAFAGNINRLRAGAVLRIPGSGALETAGAREASAEVHRQNEAWQASAPREPESARLQLVPPQEPPQPKAAVPAPAAPGASPAQDQASELEQSRRLLAIRDAELAALRQQLADLKARQDAGEVAVTPPPAGTTEAEVTAPPAGPAAAKPPAPPPEPAVRPGPPATERSWLESIGSTFGSVWVWVGLAAVLLAALFLTRRRSLAQTSRRWSPQLAGAAAAGGPANISVDDEGMVVEESMRPVSPGAFERKPTPAPPESDEELPLERTISTEGPVNLDQADPLAEADFHMAYGLYDQAADLLTGAIRAEPARRDLRMKLVDVYFIWENREGFLKTARDLRERIAGDNDPEWKRVVLMGRQLCPGDPMFSGTPPATAADMDVPLSADAGIEVDVPFVEEVGDLDFDLADAGSPHAFDPDTREAATEVARPSWAGGRGGAGTVETPTVKSVVPGGTLETPTIEARASGSSTIETPTIESPMAGSTVETPTVEAWSPDLGGTAKVTALSPPSEPADQTAEIDLDELGLDLTGLDEAAHDISTGLHEALPESAEHIDLGESDADLGSVDESTAEMHGMEPAEFSQPLERLTTAIQKGKDEETAEQPAPGLGSKSATVRALDEGMLDRLDPDLATGDESQATATGLRALRPRAAEDPTMTEVGTKLDLARAYLDMGDPDGARSILNEVLEEGDSAQRQEARQLLDTLGD
jgi:pilus assembly protein FimV